jgi:hypothetical protein
LVAENCGNLHTCTAVTREAEINQYLFFNSPQLFHTFTTLKSRQKIVDRLENSEIQLKFDLHHIKMTGVMPRLLPGIGLVIVRTISALDKSRRIRNANL